MLFICKVPVLSPPSNRSSTFHQFSYFTSLFSPSSSGKSQFCFQNLEENLDFVQVTFSEAAERWHSMSVQLMLSTWSVQSFEQCYEVGKYEWEIFTDLKKHMEIDCSLLPGHDLSVRVGFLPALHLLFTHCPITFTQFHFPTSVSLTPIVFNDIVQNLDYI